MMEFEDQAAEDHEEEEEEEEAIEAEDDDTELFPPTHPSSYDNDSVPRVTNSVISPTPLALKMSNNPETPPPLQPTRNHLNRSQLSSARYKECLKNHAVGIGGHALDGCGEFMPAGPDGSLDALKCAACNCHRNFHRKEFTDSASEKITTNLYPHPHLHPPPHIHHHPPPQVFQFYPYNRTPGPGSGFLQLPAPPQRPGPPPLQQTQPLALPCTTTTSSGDGEDITGMVSPGSSGGMMMMMTSSSKKRFRTKFTAEQKERMLELAERMGWRLHKQDEAMIQRFCEENGVKRQVLKVWMHNNKNTLGSINGGGSGGGDGDSSGGIKP